MKARIIMNPTPITIHADASIKELVNLFNNRRITGVCVVEGENKLVGVVTIYELFEAMLPDYVEKKEELAHLMPEGYFEKSCKSLRDQPVRSLMRTDVIEIREEDNLISVVADIAKFRLEVVPVTREGILLGTIHRKGLLGYTGKVLIENQNQNQD